MALMRNKICMVLYFFLFTLRKHLVFISLRWFSLHWENEFKKLNFTAGCNFPVRQYFTSVLEWRLARNSTTSPLFLIHLYHFFFFILSPWQILILPHFTAVYFWLKKNDLSSITQPDNLIRKNVLYLYLNKLGIVVIYFAYTFFVFLRHENYLKVFQV